jgi:hypothetical protein
MAGEIWIPTGVINTPMLWINEYLRYNVPELTGLPSFPFFPSTPSTIADLTEYFNNSTQGVAATWDRLIRMRRSPFPHIKQEQALYYFYAQGEDPVITMVKIQEAVLRLMDREDESAAEVNAWTKGREIQGLTCKFYFHKFRIYQLEETRDIIDFGTARTFGGNKIIIDFEYHQHKDVVGSINS